MRVLFENCDFSSRSGPNGFSLKLARALMEGGHAMLVGPHESPEVQLTFIQGINRGIPIVQRIDGVWFNTTQDWHALNTPIKATWAIARRIIVQSEFDKKLVAAYIGEHEHVDVIHNGTDIQHIESIDVMSVPSLSNADRVWSCAASWRPHKRLKENVRYFLEHAGERDVMVIAGGNPDHRVSHPRIFYAGDLEYDMLVSLYRASDFLLHLAALDNCPNTVVDARTAGCHIICSSSGGTEEIAGLDSTIIDEDEWDLQPCDLYNPPAMDFSRKRRGVYDVDVDIRNVAKLYGDSLMSAMGVS